jgi:hypothetical protein
MLFLSGSDGNGEKSNRQFRQASLQCFLEGGMMVLFVCLLNNNMIIILPLFIQD